MTNQLPNFSGIWRLTENKGFTEYLTAYGYDQDQIERFVNMKIDMEITHEGDKMTTIRRTANHSTDTTVTVGQPFIEDLATGEKLKVTPLWEGKSITFTIETLEGPKRQQKQSRYLEDDDTLILCMEVNGTSSTRIFKRVKEE